VTRVLAPPGGVRRIAVIRLSSLGDIVLTLPVVHALKAAFPDAHLAYWVKEEFADLLRHEPAIDHLRVLERDARRIEDLVSMSAELEDRDVIVDLHGNVRARVLTARQKGIVLRAPSYRMRRARWVHARWSRPRPVPHATERYAAAVAPLGVVATGSPRVVAGEAAERWAEEHIAALGGAGPLVAFCPGARHATKRWPEAHWIGLLERALALGRRVICVSTDAERREFPALAARIGSAGADWIVAPLPRVAALFSRCERVVSGDSGLMHLAAARGTQVVALFGSTSPVLGFTPSGAGHAVLCRDEPCQPCTLHGRESCPKGHFRCMNGLVPDDVAHVAWPPAD
jgi:heptosyltransferase-2